MLIDMDAAFLAYSWKLPAYGDFFAYSCVWELFLAYSLSFLLAARAFLLTMEVFCLQWESASNKQLNGL